jgi:predicted transposase YbfD/YdcC
MYGHAGCLASRYSDSIKSVKICFITQERITCVTSLKKYKWATGISGTYGHHLMKKHRFKHFLSVGSKLHIKHDLHEMLDAKAHQSDSNP